MTSLDLEALISNFVLRYRQRKNTATGWKSPSVAFADARDPLFHQLKNAVGPNHAVPQDFLPDAEIVIAYFLPFDESIGDSNKEGRNCSKAWAVAYLETNELISDLNAYITKRLSQTGYRSTPMPATHNFDTETLISDWSHRHVGYIAGLGKFGLNRMLITESGCCGRLGTLITNFPIEPTPRGAEEYCLYRFDGTCGICVQRCVAGALSIGSFDRRRCYAMCLENDRLHRDLALTDVCGKCLVGLPCSAVNPIHQ